MSASDTYREMAEINGTDNVGLSASKLTMHCVIYVYNSWRFHIGPASSKVILGQHTILWVRLLCYAFRVYGKIVTLFWLGSVAACITSHNHAQLRMYTGGSRSLFCFLFFFVFCFFFGGEGQFGKGTKPG